MFHQYVPAESKTKPIAIIFRSEETNNSQTKNDLKDTYLIPLSLFGFDWKDIAFFFLPDLKAKDAKEFLNKTFKPVLESYETKVLVVCDHAYFRLMAKKRKVHLHHGELFDWENYKVVLGVHWETLYTQPHQETWLQASFKAIQQYFTHPDKTNNAPTLTGWYPDTQEDNLKAFSSLIQHSKLTCDVETTGLDWWKCNLLSVGFGTSVNSGVVFDLVKFPNLKQQLRIFFNNYQGKLIFHNASFDVKVLIQSLWMESPEDMSNALEGLQTLFRNLEDTKLLAYVHLNSTAYVGLGLKELAFPYLGNYADNEEGKVWENVTNKCSSELLEYNLKDVCATWWVADKYQTKEVLYTDLLIPCLKSITWTEMIGLPFSHDRVNEFEKSVKERIHEIMERIQARPDVEQAQAFIQREEMEKANGKLKKTVKTIDQFQHVTFNPDSNKHIAILLFNALELSPVNYTPGGAPCTDIASLKDLVKQKPPEDVKALLQDLIALQKARKIESSFIKFFRERDLQRENKSYLVGNLNLGGTKSGRLSSSSPNLQNLPSTNTEYAKPFKQCITPDTRPWPDWLFVGADYSALEDRVSALVSKDPARLNIYEKGVDGHCQNAYAYYKDRMPDINPRDPNSINSISNKYPTLRQASKTITFALLYRATAYGLAQNTDLELPEAQKAFDAYHELYEISKEWSDAKLRQSVQQGYAELAFGLKLRCPVLTQSHTGTSHVTPQAHKETKTLANAFIQSYGLLNTVSVCKFMSRVWYSEYRLDILPCVQIHDAQYYLVRNHIPTLLWLNDNLIECMIEWPELPELAHERVKLEAELDIFWPDWAHPIRIPNNVDEKGLRKAVNLALETRK